LNEGNFIRRMETLLVKVGLRETVQSCQISTRIVIRRVLSSGIYCHGFRLVLNYVTVEIVTSIYFLEEEAKQETAVKLTAIRVS
jgi:hypothetical protein